MTFFDTYGVKGIEAQELSAILEPVLGVVFEERDSGYLGGQYFRAGERSSEHFVILRNEPDDEDDYLEPNHRDIPVILRVNVTERPAAIQALLEKIPGVVRLRSEEGP